MHFFTFILSYFIDFLLFGLSGKNYKKKNKNNCRKLAGRTIFITGASRGIGKAIALKAARDGANIVVAAKTAQPHPKLPGTIYSTADESELLSFEKNYFPSILSIHLYYLLS